ncbi:MAG: sulfur transferase domain-containing protein [Akkermansiaceae bacterium]
MIDLKSCLVSLLSLGLLGCGEEPAATNSEEDKEIPEVVELQLEGVENVYRHSSRILSGGQPDSDKGLASLKEIGVRTVISVTDVLPDLEAAEKLGLRYIHIPLTSEGITADQQKEILAAAGEGSGPVYLHCNSGCNRASAAAALCLIKLEGRPRGDVIEWMNKRGVNKEGLFEAIKNLKTDSE